MKPHDETVNTPPASTEHSSYPRLPFVAPTLTVLSVGATENGPGGVPDSGGIDYS